jgi:hypothetical protein
MTAAISSLPFRTELLDAPAGPAFSSKNTVATHRAVRSDDQWSTSSAISVSDVEIAQLVSHALESARMALDHMNPETFIRLRAVDMRMGMRKVFESLPQDQAADPAVVKEYRRGIAFQNIALNLSLDIANSIKRYARARDQEPSSGQP